MGNDSELNIIVRAKNEAGRVLAQVRDDVQGISKHVKKSFDDALPASQAVAAGVAAAGAAAVAFGVSSIKAFNESQVAIAKLENTLRSTGGVSGQTVEGLKKMASELQATTGYSDEFVMEAQNMLLTFTKIGKDTFPAATKAAIDMARQFGGDAQSNAIRLGKALNDPIQGVASLGRIGVQFSEDQKKLIASLVESGDVLGAQNIILKEIQTQAGGAADAYGKTFPGQIEILKNAFGDLQEGVGEFLAGALQPVTAAFAGWIKKVNEAGGFLEYFKKLIKDNETTVAILAGVILGALVPAVVGLGVSLWTALAPLLPFIAAGAALGLLAKVLADRMGGWGALMQRIGEIGQVVWGGLKAAFDALWPSIQALWNTIVTQLWPALQNLWNTLAPILIPALKVLAVIIGVTLYAAIWLAINVLNVVIQVISAVINWIAGFIAKVIEIGTTIFNVFMGVLNFLKPIWDLIVGIINIAWIVIATIIATAISLIMAIVQPIVNALSGPFQKAKEFIVGAWNTVAGFFGGIVTAIGNALSGVYNTITSPFAKAFDFIKELPGKIAGAIGNVGQVIKDKLGDWDIPGPLGKVRDVIPGFATGVRNFAGGFATVGEQGREAVFLPKGSTVVGNRDTERMLAGSTNNFYGTINLNTREAVEAFFTRLNRDGQLESIGAIT